MLTARVARYRLWCRFASHQWPLREGDWIDVCAHDLSLVAAIPATVLEALVAHHLDGLAVQAYLAAGVTTASPPGRIVLTPPHQGPTAKRAVYEERVRAKLRAARRRRNAPGR